MGSVFDSEEIQETCHHEDRADVIVDAADYYFTTLGQGGLAQGKENTQA